MKIAITFKTPDAVDHAIENADVPRTVYEDGVPDDERHLVVRERTEAIREQLARWVKYGELVTIEFDLDAMTARVLERKP